MGICRGALGCALHTVYQRHPEPTSVLFFGDSAHRFLIEALCGNTKVCASSLCGGSPVKVWFTGNDTSVIQTITSCDVPIRGNWSLSVFAVHSRIGVCPTPPWHRGGRRPLSNTALLKQAFQYEFHDSNLPADQATASRFEWLLQTLLTQHVPVKPNLVWFNSGLWDLARLRDHDLRQLLVLDDKCHRRRCGALEETTRGAPPRSSRQSFLATWKHNATGLLSALRNIFPTSRFGLMAAAQTGAASQQSDFWWGDRIQALNEELQLVAHEKQLPYLSYPATPAVRLLDHIHPAPSELVSIFTKSLQHV